MDCGITYVTLCLRGLGVITPCVASTLP